MAIAKNLASGLGAGLSRIGAGLGGGISSLFSGGRAPGAAIKPPVVAAPNRADYAPPTNRPTIGMPTRGDFGPGPDPSGVNAARADQRMFRQGFNNPTGTTAFTNLMGYAQEQTASAEGEANRAAQDATSRAGYVGGFQGGAKAAAHDRMSALAETGFKGAETVRGQELAGYQAATGSVDAQTQSYNTAMTAMNTSFGNALASAHAKQGELDLGFADLVGKHNLSYADAATAAKTLQAQLDQAYNGSLIDNAKYTQMNRSLQAEWAKAAMQLQEQAREFDVSGTESKRRFDLTRGDSLSEIAKQRTGAGYNSGTGGQYGPANPAPRR